MANPPDSDQLADIVRKGASRPIRKWLFLTAGLALLGGGIWVFLRRDAGDELPTQYVTEPVERGRISLVVTAAGNLAPTNQVIIGSELSGTVASVAVDTNDPVKRGQELARLDTTKLNQQTERSRASLLAAKARVGQAQATVAEAQAALARQEELHRLSEGRTPSRATMETSRATVTRAEADLDSALADVAGAEAEVGAFERDLEKAIIRSPVDGVVLARSIEVGQTVAASFTAPTLFTIAEDLKKMELVVSVSEADIGRVEAGQSASFSVDAWPTRSYTAKVMKVAFGSNNTQTANGSNANAAAAASTTGVVTYSTELEVENEDLSLRPGMTATVDISIVDKPDILVVPNSALRFDPEVAAAIGKPDDDSERTIVQSLTPGGRRWRGNAPPKPGARSTEPRVWVLKDGQPAEVKVSTGITDGRHTEITGGPLKEGMQVITTIKPAPAE